jgi:hypothetical protein
MLTYLNGISKVIGHVNVAGSDKDYEPALYIINEHSSRFQGTSFIIALSAMHKYVNPFLQYTDPKLITMDAIRFTELKEELLNDRMQLGKGVGILTRDRIFKSNADLACLMFAEVLCKTNNILLVTGYNLAKCMQMFDIQPVPQAACQLLLFIEDSLDDLKNAPMAIPDNKYLAGGMALYDGSTKIYSGDWIIPESELIEERFDATVN